MKKLLLSATLLLFALTASAALVTTLLLNTSTVGAGTSYTNNYQGYPQNTYANRWYQATLNGASAVSATVEIDGSTDNVNWVPMITITLPKTSTGAMTDGAATVQTAPYVRGNLLAISGVGATVTLISGE